MFSELYSAYYNTVAKIVRKIIEDGASAKEVNKIIEETAFEESNSAILHAIEEERWQVVTRDFTTPIKNVPTMPLTTLQKRWLKAILLDDRIKLFNTHFDGLEDVVPLFTKDDYTIFDKCLDGDNYTSEKYINIFKTIIYATHKRLPLKIKMQNRIGNDIYVKAVPIKIEYSEKDDKFRVIVSGSRNVHTINVGRITKCELYGGNINVKSNEVQESPCSVTLIITDDRNALERTMLHFAHFEKRVEKIGRNKYKAVINYDESDESEMVIRVLSFGPHIRVVEPSKFIHSIKEKLKKQQSCELK